MGKPSSNLLTYLLTYLGYGMSINIVEVSWKAKLKMAFPNPNDYSMFMGTFSSITGSVTLFMMLLGRRIFKVCMCMCACGLHDAPRKTHLQGVHVHVGTYAYVSVWCMHCASACVRACV